MPGMLRIVFLISPVQYKNPKNQSGIFFPVPPVMPPETINAMGTPLICSAVLEGPPGSKGYASSRVKSSYGEEVT